MDDDVRDRPGDDEAEVGAQTHRNDPPKDPGTEAPIPEAKTGDTHQKDGDRREGETIGSQR